MMMMMMMMKGEDGERVDMKVVNKTDGRGGEGDTESRTEKEGASWVTSHHGPPKECDDLVGGC